VKAALLLLTSCLLISNYAYASNNIRLLATENYPPLNYVKDNVLIGPAVDIVETIQSSLNSHAKIEIYPWKRAFLTATSKKNTAIFSLARSKKREHLFKWVGPIATKKYAFYALNNSPIIVNSLDDAHSYIIGIQNGGITEEYLFSEGFNKLHPVTTPKQNLGKLLKGRIDLWYVNNATLVEQAKIMSIPLSQLREVFVVKNEQFYIGFNKNTPNKTISLWQNAYQHLYQQGIIKQIYKKHKLLSLYPTNLTPQQRHTTP